MRKLYSSQKFKRHSRKTLWNLWMIEYCVEDLSSCHFVDNGTIYRDVVYKLFLIFAIDILHLSPWFSFLFWHLSVLIVFTGILMSSLVNLVPFIKLQFCWGFLMLDSNYCWCNLLRIHCICIFIYVYLMYYMPSCKTFHRM